MRPASLEHNQTNDLSDFFVQGRRLAFRSRHRYPHRLRDTSAPLSRWSGTLGAHRFYFFFLSSTTPYTIPFTKHIIYILVRHCLRMIKNNNHEQTHNNTPRAFCLADRVTITSHLTSPRTRVRISLRTFFS